MKTPITYTSIIIFLIGITAAFFIGRYTIADGDPIIKYIKGDVIEREIVRDSIIPYRVEVIKYIPDTVTVLRVDTFNNTIAVLTKVDTFEIVKDYLLRRYYNEELFSNDTLGELTIHAEVERNTLSQLSYTFTPIYKETTIHRKRLIIPFIGASYNTLGMFGVGGGMFYNSLGVELKYLLPINSAIEQPTAWEIGIKYKF